MSQITVYSPLGVNLVEARAISPRVGALDGVRLGILNNSKTNSELLQDEIVRLLEERYRLADVVKNVKPNASRGAAGLSGFAGQVEAVVTALGD